MSCWNVGRGWRPIFISKKLNIRQVCYMLQLLSGVGWCERPADGRRRGVSGSIDDRRLSAQRMIFVVPTKIAHGVCLALGLCIHCNLFVIIIEIVDRLKINYREHSTQFCPCVFLHTTCPIFSTICLDFSINYPHHPPSKNTSSFRASV